ncbi:alpha/beta hydrolase [Promineifilum sp.]|uniref:alpha/beta hydrolase n=1 Tax=Promineifilum sp. TaxID=2664178 RepID=UPI0035AF5CCB
MTLELLTSDLSAATRPTPLLLVHGAWHGAWCWQEHFIPYLARAGYAVYAPSLRGHGASPGRDRLRRTGIGHYVRDVAAVAAALPAAPVLIGHSMGGLVVQKYLERHPAAAGVLLASVPPAGTLATALRIARRHPRAFLKANATLSLYPLVETPELAGEHFFSPDVSDELFMVCYPQLQDESYRAFLDMTVFSRARPKRVSVPMLILGAANDRIFTLSEVEATARAYGTTATIFPDMAHDMMLEAGWRDVADTILAWLDERGF